MKQFVLGFFRGLAKGTAILAIVGIVLAVVIVGGAGLGLGIGWLVFKGQPADIAAFFNPPPKPDYTQPAEAKWPLCWRCEYQPARKV